MPMSHSTRTLYWDDTWKTQVTSESAFQIKNRTFELQFFKKKAASFHAIAYQLIFRQLDKVCDFRHFGDMCLIWAFCLGACVWLWAFCKQVCDIGQFVQKFWKGNCLILGWLQACVWFLATWRQVSHFAHFALENCCRYFSIQTFWLKASVWSQASYTSNCVIWAFYLSAHVWLYGHFALHIHFLFFVLFCFCFTFCINILWRQMFDFRYIFHLGSSL